MASCSTPDYGILVLNLGENLKKFASVVDGFENVENPLISPLYVKHLAVN